MYFTSNVDVNAMPQYRLPDCKLVYYWQSVACVKQTMEDMTAHDRRTTFLAIRLYHVIYTVLRTGSR